MNEPPTIRTERVDDFPLLLSQMEYVGIACLLDVHFPTHSNNERTVSKHGADFAHEQR